VKPKINYFGLFRFFEPISKQPKQTELFRNKPKQIETTLNFLKNTKIRKNNFRNKLKKPKKPKKTKNGKTLHFLQKIAKYAPYQTFTRMLCSNDSPFPPSPLPLPPPGASSKN
jgi:hypothetical protein